VSYVGREPQFGEYIVADSIALLQNGVRTNFPITSNGEPVVMGTVNALFLAKNGLTLYPLDDFLVGGDSTSIDFIVPPTAIDDISIRVLGNVFDTLTVEDNVVTSSKIQNSAVTSAKLADNAVTASKIADNTVTSTKISSNAVTASKILDGSVSTNKLIDASVNNAKLVDGAVSYVKISSSSITNTPNDIVIGAVGKLVDAATLKSFKGTPPIFRLRQQYSTGVAGGQRANANQWEDSNLAGGVILNTLHTNNITGAAHNSSNGQFTLPTGTYILDGWKFFHNVGQCKFRFYNITDNNVLAYSVSGWASGAAGHDRTPIENFVFTLTAPKTFKFQSWVAGTSGINQDLGIPGNDGVSPEIYADFTFEKIA